MKPSERPGLICLAGATATGKSEVALVLAERFAGEIISVDSMQVYRGLNIGTAKPAPADRDRVPHHLIDVVDLTETFDAARFARLAHAAVNDIQARGKVAILCGGTGFYFKAFLEGVGAAPPANAALRSELERVPLSELLGELEAKDPATFAVIDRKNARRVIRAIEVIRLTGKPFSEQRAKWEGDASNLPVPGSRREEAQIENGRSQRVPTSAAPAFFGLVREPQDLQTRINARVDLMFQRGLVDEVRELLRLGLAENQTAMQAIGYRQVVEHLRGERPLAQTVELVKIRTRQFAKRQMTWFRRHANLNWLHVAPEATAEATAAAIIEQLQTKG